MVYRPIGVKTIRKVFISVTEEAYWTSLRICSFWSS